ncbi:MAG: ketoacyl-ACP synthase III [Flavobacteriaceae bacterium]|jgi:3-oxoacyl-[acyl-carrier-protein] synthase III|nr:ketoacyl-ACP synthase III [Flavobacteriaceae bacterium]
MTTKTAAITAVGGYVPEHVLTNADIEQLVDTSDEWIVSRTGIKERRILKPTSLGTSFMAIKAAQNLLDKKNLDPTQIDLVIVATATPDMPVSSTAAYVATEIGATNAFAYDLQGACSGFLFGMSAAAAYISSGRYNNVLLIGADTMSSIIDYSDRATCVIFGDGAGAVLFEPNDEGLGLQDELLRVDGKGRTYLKIEAGGSMLPASKETVSQKQHFLHQEGRPVFKFAVSNMSAAITQVITRNGLSKDDIDFVVAHQANKRILDAISNHLNLKSDQMLINIDRYGNTTAATLPLLLWDYEHLLKKNQKLLFTAFGGGFTWGASYLTWAYNS